MVDAGDNEDLLVKLASINASYTAHGMKQRLPASDRRRSIICVAGRRRRGAARHDYRWWPPTV
jgi:hypothetical protein